MGLLLTSRDRTIQCALLVVLGGVVTVMYTSKANSRNLSIYSPRYLHLFGFLHSDQIPICFQIFHSPLISVWRRATATYMRYLACKRRAGTNTRIQGRAGNKVLK